MKKTLFLLILAAAFASGAAPTLTIDSVRQRWPFSTKVDIGFTISGGTAGTYYHLKDFAVYDGDRAIATKPGDFENVRPVYANGSYTIVFEPRGTALTNTVDVRHFKVGFDVSATEVRYLVLDLTKENGEAGAVEYVCAGDARLESYVRQIDYLDTDNVTPKQTSITYDDAWLSLTNKTFVSGSNKASQYAIGKMVFRLVRPGNYVVGKGDGPTYNDVTLTKPYFIGVFPLTMGQYGQMRYGDWTQKDSTRDTNVGNQSRQQTIFMNDLRGQHDDPTYPVDWIQYGHQVCPTSFLGRVRAKYGLAFDIPTETQWEVAARAGTRGYYYVDDSTVVARNDNLLLLIGNLGGTSNVLPGEKLANAWGVYDLLYHGQSVLDNRITWDVNNISQNPWPSGTDPAGAGTTWNGCTFSKGGGHHKNAVSSVGLRGGSTNVVPGDWTTSAYNVIRLVVNVD